MMRISFRISFFPAMKKFLKLVQFLQSHHWSSAAPFLETQRRKFNVAVWAHISTNVGRGYRLVFAGLLRTRLFPVDGAVPLYGIAGVFCGRGRTQLLVIWRPESGLRRQRMPQYVSFGPGLWRYSTVEQVCGVFSSICECSAVTSRSLTCCHIKCYPVSILLCQLAVVSPFHYIVQ